MSLRRIDAELVRRGLARSREDARTLVESGHVRVKGMVVTKAQRQVDADDPIAVSRIEGISRVSRGSHKLEGALEAFPQVTVAGKPCLDAGASTGGFTQVLLERGAALVYAVDVGYGQLAWSLQSDARVAVMDRTNVRTLQAGQFDPAPQLVVADLSFISLKTVLPALRVAAADRADFVLMVKPQFEVGKKNIGKKGVVRDPALRRQSVLGVAEAALELGLGCAGVAASPLPGATGNVEYFLWLQAAASPVREDDVARAVEQGPS